MKKIDHEKLYTPNELVRDMAAFKSRQMVLRNIRREKLKATNFGSDKKPRYVVQGKHLVEYLNGSVSPREYTKK